MNPIWIGIDKFLIYPWVSQFLCSFSQNTMRNTPCSDHVWQIDRNTSLWGGFQGILTAKICTSEGAISPAPELELQENEKWERNIRMCSSGVDDPTSALHCGTFWVTCSIFLAKCRRANSAGTTHIYLAEYH